MKWRCWNIGCEKIMPLIPGGIGLDDRNGQRHQQDRRNGKIAESDGQWRARMGNLAIDRRNRAALHGHGKFRPVVFGVCGALPRVGIVIHCLRHDARGCGSDQPKRSRESEYSPSEDFQLFAKPAQHD